MDNGAFRSYLRRFVGTLLVSIIVAALFNLWVNPYRLFHVFRETPATSVKARPGSNIADIKLLNAIGAKPQAVIIGNSRADIGFNPEHIGWAEYRGHVYNLAVPGAGVQRVRDDFRALLERSHVRVALLAVDFQDFVLNSQPPEFKPSSPPPGEPDALLVRQRMHALFTMTGLADSLRTLGAKHQPYPATLRADGLNPLLDYVPIAARDGYPSMFRQRLNETTANFVRARTGIFPPGEADSAEFAALRDILRMASEHDVELYVTTYPYHAQYFMLFEELGIWVEFGNWKRAILRTVETSNARQNDARQAILWDFAAVSEPSTTQINDSAEHGAGRWYWEAGHFKQSLGDLVLDTILARTPEDHLPAGLGIRLTNSNVDDWLELQTAALAQFASEQPNQLSEVRSAVARAREAVGPSDNLSTPQQGR